MGDFVLPASARALFVGKTGAGKTTLARALCSGVRRLLVVDGKGTLHDWGCENFTDESAQAFMERGHGRLRAVAPVGVADSVGFYDSIYQWAMSQTDLLVYTDEIYAIVPPGTKAPTYFNALYTRGREFNIGAWGSTQRPAWIPLFCISESEFFFIFRLTMAEDRARMAQVCGESVNGAIEDKHGFWYYDLTQDNPQYFERAQIEN